MFYKNCPFCGEEYDENSKVVVSDYPNSLQCSFCKKIFYNNPKPTAAGLLVENNKIILVKRKYEPYKGYWGLPGGFLNYGEDPIESVTREMKEELNIDISSPEMIDMFHMFYPIDKTDKLSLIVFVYKVNFNVNEIKAGDDAEEWAFFDRKSLPEAIAFPEQKKYLKECLDLIK